MSLLETLAELDVRVDLEPLKRAEERLGRFAAAVARVPAPKLSPTYDTTDPLKNLASQARQRDTEIQGIQAAAMAKLGPIAEKTAAAVEIAARKYAQLEFATRRATDALEVQSDKLREAEIAAYDADYKNKKLNRTAEKQSQIFYRLAAQVDRYADATQKAAAKVQSLKVEPSVQSSWLSRFKGMLFGAQEASSKTNSAIQRDFDETKEKGTGVVGVVAKLRRVWGLFQFAVAAALGLTGIKNFIDEMGDAADAAKTFGMTVEDYQVLETFAALGGATTADTANVIKQLAKNIHSATEGTKEHVMAFKELKVEYEDVVTGKPREAIDVFFEVGGALQATENSTERLALAQKLLGKQALTLLPAFEAGKDSAQAQLKVLRELAVVYSQDTAEAAEALGDTLFIVQRQFKGIALEAVAVLMPVLTRAARAFQEFGFKLRQVIQHSSTIHAILVHFGAMLGALVITKITGLKFGLRTLIPILIQLGKFVMRFMAPWLLLDDVITWLRGGDSLLGRWLERIGGAGTSLSFLMQVWDWIYRIQDLAGGLAAAFRNAFRWLDSNNLGIEETLNPEDMLAEDDFRRAIAGLTDEIAAAFDRLWDYAGQSFMNMVNRIFGSGGSAESETEPLLVDLGGSALKWLMIGFLAQIPLVFPAIFGEVVGFLGAAIVSGIQAAIPLVISAGTAVIAALGLPVTVGIAALGALVTLYFTDFGHDLIHSAIDPIGEAFSAIFDFVGQKMKALGGILSDAMDSVESFFGVGKAKVDLTQVAKIQASSDAARNVAGGNRSITSTDARQFSLSVGQGATPAEVASATSTGKSWLGGAPSFGGLEDAMGGGY